MSQSHVMLRSCPLKVAIQSQLKFQGINQVPFTLFLGLSLGA